jgi:hypothetical protein
MFTDQCLVLVNASEGDSVAFFHTSQVQASSVFCIHVLYFATISVYDLQYPFIVNFSGLIRILLIYPIHQF